jgi:AAA+ ATPase superfamily predicted ATPase
MSKSPFLFGTTVSVDSFTNREEEVEKLIKNLTQGINTMLISPRRWGKSSLVEKVIYKLNTEKSQFRTVSIDLFSVSSEEEFLELFAKEVIKASSSVLQDWVNAGKEFFQQLIPKLSLGLDPQTDFSLSFDWNELKKHRTEILNLPEKIAEAKGIVFIICLDEFQNLSSFQEYEQLEKAMRATWQRQKKVTYCLYGSKRHMMTDIFNNPSKPFYRFGAILMLQKIKREKWISFIVDSFAQTNKTISPDVATWIPTLMKDHSWYVQQLAHYTWQSTDKIAGIEEINNALQELIHANSPLYQREIETLSTTQVNLLKAISSQEPKLSSQETIQKFHLGTSASVTKNKGILINADVITDENGTLQFLDPAFELWFQKLFFRKSFELK